MREKTGINRKMIGFFSNFEKGSVYHDLDKEK